MTRKVQVLVIYYEEENESVINQILNKSQIGYEINNNWGEITMPFCGPQEHADELIGQLETLKSKKKIERKIEIDKILYTQPDRMDEFREELESLGYPKDRKTKLKDIKVSKEGVNGFD